MRKVFMSFLGLGAFNKEKGEYSYTPAHYELNGKQSKLTEFVQAAELEILGAENFDMIYIFATEKSHETHFENLCRQIQNADPEVIFVTEDMSAEGQWKLFETILSCVEIGDNLTIDMTHGYRLFPIVFSAAIHFLKKARNIQLNAVYYGAFDKNRNLSPIIDMKDFYNINEWAEAVGRLVDEADARKLAEISQTTSDYQIGELNDEKIISAFDDLTNTLRNVDVNNVGRKANEALEQIRKKEQTATITGKLLLKLVIDKFTTLTTRQPPTGKYDKEYFQIQIEIIDLLIEHKLFMQAYTAMREIIASIAMIPFEKEGMKNRKRKKKRHRYGEVFVNMFQFDRKEWNFSGKETQVERMLPFYSELESIGVVSLIRSFIKELVTYRNGFDHAWIAKSGAPKDIHIKAETFSNKLKEVLSLLDTHGYFDYPK